MREERERAVQEQKSQEAESQKGAESQKEEERQERRICISTQTQAQQQVFEEMIPPREGQGADITCGITVAVDACLNGGGSTQHSRNTTQGRPVAGLTVSLTTLTNRAYSVNNML